MKSIITYIKEAVETYRLNEIEATYNVQPEEIILHPANEYVKQFVVDNLKYKIDSLSKFIGIKND